MSTAGVETTKRYLYNFESVLKNTQMGKSFYYPNET